jgi:hypothetical protein
MEFIEQLRNEITAIGERLVVCSENCEGVQRNQAEGILPRCLILETEGRTTLRGCIVCGINPAPAKQNEVEFYRKNGGSYKSLLQWWEHYKLKDIDYYRRLRAFVSGLDFDGPILWTDIAKCQNKSLTVKLTIKDHPQTFRRCSALFLTKEIEKCPADWPIIAAGREAFLALLYLCPNRALIGIPHPTGSYANTQFLRLFENGLKLKSEVKMRINEYFQREPRGIFKVLV